MNCKPNDVAVVIRDITICDLFGPGHVRIVKSGTIVRVLVVDANAVWTIEDPFVVRGVFACGIPFHCTVTGIDDSELRPLKGDGVSDDEVRELYGPVLSEACPV